METEDEDNINWDLCIICQNETKEKLQCPANETHLRCNIGSGYATLSRNLKEFAKFGVKTIAAEIFDNSNLESILLLNKGKWHKSCSLKYNNTSLSRLRKRSLLATNEDDVSLLDSSVRRKSLRQSGKSQGRECLCFFCDQPSSEKESLHEVMTLQVDSRVRKVATMTQDKRILAKLAGGDMVAIEAAYHRRCLASYYNIERSNEKSSEPSSEAIVQGIALTQILRYIDEQREEGRQSIFKLSDLVRLYAATLKDLGVEIEERIHSTHLKNRILATAPYLEARNSGREVFIGFQEDIGDILHCAYKEDGDEQGRHLAMTAEILRDEIFKSKSRFEGCFREECQQNAVPNTLLTLIKMILNGPGIAGKSEMENENRMLDDQAALSIAQLIVHNSYKRRRQSCSGGQEHRSKDRETPLPVYVGLKIYSNTRKAGLVDELFKLGLSISYNRVLEIKNAICVAECNRFRADGLVSPQELVKGVFVTSAYDNLDHNPTSTTSEKSFHGTGISLFQHPNPNENIEPQQVPLPQQNGLKGQWSVPPFFVNFKSMYLKEKDNQVPTSNYGVVQSDSKQQRAFLDDEWLQGLQSGNSGLSWAAFHARKAQSLNERQPQKSISSMLPLFKEDLHSVSLMCHAMNLIKKATAFVNPGQIPVITFDQPLFCIAKNI